MMKRLVNTFIASLILLAVPVMADAQQTKESSSNLVFSAAGWYGLDMEKIRPVELTNSGYMTYEASVGFQTRPEDNCQYARAFGFPMFSVGISVANMGDFKFVDNSKFPVLTALYGSFERSLLRRKYFSCGYQLDFGLAYNPERYDPVASPANNWLSSPVMAYFGAGAFAKLHVGKHWEVGANAMFRHFSNGRTGLPNEALNAVGVGIFARYRLDEYDYKEYAMAPKGKYQYKKGMQYAVVLGTGIHTCQAEWNKYAFDATYRYSLRYATGIGVDLFYSSNMKELEAADRILYGDEAVENSPGYSPISIGLAVVQEVYYRNFAIHIAIGAYPYRKKGVNDKELNEKMDDRERGWHYEKAGFRYYFPKFGDTFLGFAIKSHSIKAEYLEFSAGVRF